MLHRHALISLRVSPTSTVKYKCSRHHSLLHSQTPHVTVPFIQNRAAPIASRISFIESSAHCCAAPKDIVNTQCCLAAAVSKRPKSTDIVFGQSLL